MQEGRHNPEWYLEDAQDGDLVLRSSHSVLSMLRYVPHVQVHGVAASVREACTVFLKRMYMEHLESFPGLVKLLHCWQLFEFLTRKQW
jgi:hypothetical protein